MTIFERARLVAAEIYPAPGSDITYIDSVKACTALESADADIASGDTQLRLRFGHDSGIAPLLVVLDANGYGRATSSFEESLEIFPDYNLPMGASAQFVFYRNDAGDILFKLLVNEQEATLPLRPVQGPYYSWSGFKKHYLPIIRASKRKIANS